MNPIRPACIQQVNQRDQICITVCTNILMWRTKIPTWYSKHHGSTMELSSQCITDISNFPITRPLIFDRNRNYMTAYHPDDSTQGISQWRLLGRQFEPGNPSSRCDTWEIRGGPRSEPRRKVMESREKEAGETLTLESERIVERELTSLSLALPGLAPRSWSRLSYGRALFF